MYYSRRAWHKIQSGSTFLADRTGQGWDTDETCLKHVWTVLWSKSKSIFQKVDFLRGVQIVKIENAQLRTFNSNYFQDRWVLKFYQLLDIVLLIQELKLHIFTNTPTPLSDLHSGSMLSQLNTPCNLPLHSTGAPFLILQPSRFPIHSILLVIVPG